MSSRNILLNAIGPQDEYININPNTTFLKNSHLTYTNFSKIEHLIYPTSQQSDNITYSFGELVIFDIEKPSDLLLNIKVEFVLEGDWEHSDIVPETLYSLIEYIEIVSDNKILQKLTGHWMYLWNQLNDPTNKLNIPTHAYASSNQNLINHCPQQYKLMLNIPFWFSQSPGLALPLWAIQNERLFVRLKLRNFSEISYNLDSRNYIIRSIQLISDIVELDMDEKKSFQDRSLEYVIEQIEFNGIIDIPTNSKNKLKITLEQYNYVNEIIWIFTGKCFEHCVYMPTDYFNFWPGFNGNSNVNYKDHTIRSNISLNGKPINQKLNASYYRKVQRFQYHDSSKDIDKNLDPIEKHGNYNCIYNYSFSLQPNKIKPSGFLSTDKFNTINLNLELIPFTYDRNLFIFQKRLNIIRIKDGFINILNS